MKPRQRIGIFGTSGFALEAADVVSLNGGEPLLIAQSMDDAPAIDPGLRNLALIDPALKIVPQSQVDSLELDGFVIAIGNNDVRKRIHDEFASLPWTNLVHPDTTIGDSSLRSLSQRRGCIILAGARVSVNVRFGDFTILNLNASVSHDCLLHDFCNICPGVNLSGNVEVGAGTFLGTNTSVVNGGADERLRIAAGTYVGAGTVITESITESGVYVGAPARRIK